MINEIIVKKRNVCEAMEDIIQHFIFETDSQIEQLWDDDTACPMAETKERLAAYLCYVRGETTPDIAGYLTEFGCSPSVIEKFSTLSGELEGKLKSVEEKRQRYREIILSYSLADTLSLLENVLHDSEEDPHYSAITTDRLLQNYLVCKDLEQKYSVRDFLKTQGYSTADVNVLYEHYRKECLDWYGSPPKGLLYSNGILRAYEVGGIFVVAILALKKNKVMDPRGAEFTADRQVKWTKKLDLVELPEPRKLLGKTAKELRAELGEAHVSLTFGENENVPSYITNQGHLVGFILSRNRVTDCVELNLLKR